jgi:hypothetical protein
MAREFSGRSRGQRLAIIAGAVLVGLVAIGKVAGPPKPTSAAAAAADFEFITLPGMDNYVMIFPAGSDPVALEKAARTQCYGKQICQVLGWTDKSDAAPRLPMLDRELATLAFSYNLNRNSSYEKVLYSCARFPKIPKDRCLSTE